LAAGSGGFWGRGLGGSLQKFLFLPQPHTDFIFSILAEETGFLGTGLIFLLFGALFWRGLWIARRIRDRLGRLLVGGLIGMIFIYFLLHVGVALGVLPPTGLPLPFISFGGSALISNLWAVGVIMNVSKYIGDEEVDESSDSRWWYRRPYLSGTFIGSND
jgi:cell division protein FtsW